MFRVFLSALTMTVLCVSSLAHGQDDAPRIRPERIGQTPGAGRVSVNIPRQIHPVTLSRWFSPLSLSEAQKLHLERLYEQYEERDIALREEKQPALYQWAESLAADGMARAAAGNDAITAPEHQDYLDDQREMRKYRDTFVAELLALDEIIFSGMEQVLADVQAEKLHQVRARRMRDVYSSISMEQPGARVDLWFWIEMMRTRQWLDVDDKQVFLSHLDMYEQKLTQQLKELYDFRTGPDARRLSRLQIEAIQLGDPQTRTAYRRLAERSPGMQLDIARLNRQYAKQLADLMTSDSRDRFLSIFRQQTYPEIYPDPFSLEDIHSTILALDGLDCGLLEAIEITFADAARRQEEIAERMVDEIERWIFSRSANRRALDEHVKTLDTLQSERRAAAEQAIALVQNVMGEHALDEDFQATVQSFKQRADARQPRTFGMRHRP